MTAPHTLLFSGSLVGWQSTCWVLCRMYFTLGLSGGFSWVGWDCRVWGRKATGQVPFSSVTSRVPATNGLTDGVNHGRLAEVMFLRFLFCRGTFPFLPFPHCSPENKVALYVLYLRERKLGSSSVREVRLQKLVGIILYERFVCLISIGLIIESFCHY